MNKINFKGINRKLLFRLLSKKLKPEVISSVSVMQLRRKKINGEYINFHFLYNSLKC
jgi:hypothetical protein